MTTIREAIDRLVAVADSLPRGLDSDLEVVMCDGTDIVSAPLAEIDTLVELTESGQPKRAWGIVKGHSHADGAMTARGVAQDLDEELRRLTDSDEG